jgi:hypothetical protein
MQLSFKHGLLAFLVLRPRCRLVHVPVNLVLEHEPQTQLTNANGLGRGGAGFDNLKEMPILI